MNTSYDQYFKPLFNNLLNEILQEESKLSDVSKISGASWTKKEILVERPVEEYVEKIRLGFKKIDFLSNFTKTINDLKNQTMKIQEIKNNLDQTIQENGLFSKSQNCLELINATKAVCNKALATNPPIPNNPYQKHALIFEESIQELAAEITQTYEKLVRKKISNDDTPQFGIYRFEDK